MPTIVYAFNLEASIEPSVYEKWAKTIDLPAVRSLDCVNSYRILRTEAPTESGDDPPVSYIEIIEATSTEALNAALASHAMKNVVATFEGFTRNRLILKCESLDGAF